MTTDNPCLEIHPRFVCFVFTHDYLFSLGKGIQAGHAQVCLVGKYCLTEIPSADNIGSAARLVRAYHAQDVVAWVTKHHTTVVKSGGFSKTMAEILQVAERCQDTFPFAAFYEDDETLNNMLTAVAVLIDMSGWESTYEIIKGKHDVEFDGEEAHIKAPAWREGLHTSVRIKTEVYEMLKLLAKRPRAT